MRVISLGWGVQSWTMAAMTALGELPPVDAAIHADTTHEAEHTYQFAERWAPWLEARGVRVVTVRAEGELINPWRMVTIPAYTSSALGGQLRRQCTGAWKISPMRRWLSAELKAAGLSKRAGAVELLLGISLDEVERLKPSTVKYIRHSWPLIDRRMSRHSCAVWLGRQGLEVPGKSACVFCPYHNAAGWLDLKARGGADWDKALEVDDALRLARPPFDLYLHRSRRPLSEAIEAPNTNQLAFTLEAEECAGVCFL